MSVPYGKHYGASFKEAVIIYESLLNMNFVDEEKEADRLTLIDYTYKKLNQVYPMQWDDYHLRMPTGKKPNAVADEIEDTE